MYVDLLLPMIAAQAETADQTRSINAEVIAAIKATDLMRLSASTELGGLNATTCAIGDELRAVAAACSSTAWCLWNHLCTFHLFCGLLGPVHHRFLQGIVDRHE